MFQNKSQILRVVITGASGFIGGHLKKKLEKIPGIQVVGVSRRDVRGLTRVSSYLDSPEADLLIHLAGNNINSGSIKKELFDHYSRQLSELKELSTKYSRVIFASSAALYGDTLPKRYKTQDRLILGSEYTYFKWASEMVLLEHPNSIILRLSNVYGAGMSEKNVISSIVHKLASPGDVFISRANHIRDFIAVDDVVEAFGTIILSKWNIGNRVYNLGTGHGTSIKTLANLILSLSAQKNKKIFFQDDSNFSSNIVDCEELNKNFGWQFRIHLRDGLKTLIGSVGL